MTSAHKEDTQLAQLKDKPCDKAISPLMTGQSFDKWTCYGLCAQKSSVVDIKD